MRPVAAVHAAPSESISPQPTIAVPRSAAQEISSQFSDVLNISELTKTW
jgi:hypothetical protein